MCKLWRCHGVWRARRATYLVLTRIIRKHGGVEILKDLILDAHTTLAQDGSSFLNDYVRHLNEVFTISHHGEGRPVNLNVVSFIVYDRLLGDITWNLIRTSYGQFASDQFDLEMWFPMLRSPLMMNSEEFLEPFIFFLCWSDIFECLRGVGYFWRTQRGRHLYSMKILLE